MSQSCICPCCVINGRSRRVVQSTHTYAILEVDPEIYKKIRAQLEEAGYGHAFHRGNNDDEVIDMHGIALQSKAEK